MIHNNHIGRGRGIAAACLIAVFLLQAGWAMAQGASQGQTLNFRDADIRAFIEDIAMFTGDSFIIGPRVQGKVTVIAEQPLGREAIFQVFLSTLRAHGYTVAPTASGAYRIVAEDSAAQAAQPVGPDVTGDRFLTEVFHLDNIDAQTAMRALQTVVHEEGRALAQPGTDFLIVVDYASNMERIREIVARIDRDRTVVRSVRLENLSAGEMAEIVRDLTANGEDSRDGGRVRVMAVEGANTLVLRGLADALDRLVPTVREIDAQGANRGSLRVFYLKHAAAEQMVALLREVTQSLSPDGASSGPRRASIAVHAESNALVVSAEPDMLLALEGVINQLDRRRSQVMVEAIIVEVSDTAARDLGLQYILSGSEGSNVPFIASNFSQTAPDILASTGAIVVDQETSGDSDALDNLQQLAISSLLGINGFAGGFAGITDGGTLFGAILTALDQDVSSNILSTPHIMTMDNEAARVNVGQEVPISTGEVVGANLENPFRTIDRRDVGVQLEVTPQINDGDVVTLRIRQEVSSVLGPATGSVNDLIFNTREVETVVSANSGEIIVLGGLIEEDEQVSLQKVPFLGDIPGLGYLFRSESRSKVKTNLMVFIRPTILRGAEDTRAMTRDKFNYIRAEQILRSDSDEASIDRYMDGVTGATPDGY